MSQSERESIVTQSLNIITEGMNADDKINILSVIEDVPSNDRDNVIEQSLRLITPDMFADDIVKVIRRVAVIMPF